jgi:tetratricopeptide (TPR) repeat protein
MLRLYAASLESAGDTPKAFDVMQRAIRANPRDERLLIDLAILCMDHKNLDLGLELVEIGIQASPASARLQTLKGVLLVRHGDLEKGQEAFRDAQKLSPQDGLGSIGLASAMMQMGLASEAARLLREQAPKSDLRAGLTLARALLLQSPVKDADIREAIALLEQIVKKEPGNATAYGLLGKAQMQPGGDPRKAEAAFAAAIRLDPADRASTYQLMLLYRKSGRTREAMELSRKVQALVNREAEDEAAGSRFRVLRESETPQ